MPARALSTAAPSFAPSLRLARTSPSAWACIVLTPAVLFVHGFHPFAGDAGLYVAGLRHLLDPTLYPRNAVFVTAFTHRSIFAFAMAAFIRLTRLPLAWALLFVHLFSIWLFLFACRRLAVRLFASEAVRLCAVLLAAACFTLPVAGTALVLMDPYVTARSFATPLGLLAVAAAVQRRWLRTTLLLALAIALHPLMGAYACAFVLLLGVVAARRIRLALFLCAAAVAVCAAIFLLAHRDPIDPAYRQAVLLAPRSFLFLARWRWYEDLGLVLPLLLFALGARALGPGDPRRSLCLAALLLGGTAVLIAALFVPPAGPYPLVPLQVLRGFHILYAVGMVLAAGPVRALFGRSRVAAAAFFVALFAGMFLAEPLSWPACRRVEWPGAAPVNPYRRAFLWIRGHTPPDAVFAFNPQLVYLPNEDEQGFRAISERDHLADDKDAGVAAVIPSLAGRWTAQRDPELGLGRMTDTQRRAALTSLGATWLLLPPGAPTAFPCPWRNSVVQVCRLTP
jgi:hypothetical protein